MRESEAIRLGPIHHASLTLQRESYQNVGHVVQLSSGSTKGRGLKGCVPAMAVVAVRLGGGVSLYLYTLVRLFGYRCSLFWGR